MQDEIVQRYKTAKELHDKLYAENDKQRRMIKKLKESVFRDAITGKLVQQHYKHGETADLLLQQINLLKDKLMKERKIRRQKKISPLDPKEYLFNAPKGWSWVRINDLCMNLDYGTSEKTSVDQKGVPILRMNNIDDGQIIFENLKYLNANSQSIKNLALESGDILFNRTNSKELVGKSAVFLREGYECSFASYLIRLRLFEGVEPEFVNFFLSSNLCRSHFIDPEVTQQCGQANFNGTKLAKIFLCLPPSEEQKRIVEKVKKIASYCNYLALESYSQRNFVERSSTSLLRNLFLETVK